jgi:hypothetical protein
MGIQTVLESGPGFCRFPGLDPSEAERPSGGSRFPTPGRDSSRSLLPESTLTAEGQDEKLAGKVEKKVGQVEKVFEK